MPRVLLADDDPEVRRAYEVILNRYPEILVVGAAPNGPSVIAMARDLGPDVVLLDLQMPEMTGEDVLLEWQRSGRAFKVLVLTSFDDTARVVSALRAGADGYLLKSSPGERIARAIEAVLRDEFPVTPNVVRELVSAPPSGAAIRMTLTRREHDVLRGLARGLTNQDLANELFIEVSTVKQYVGTLAAKLGASNRVQVVVAAAGLGLVTLAPPVVP